MAPPIIKTALPFPVFSLEADRDYLLARHINILGAGFHSRAGYMAQQACEKYMKAVTVQASGDYLQTHQLILLAEHCAKIDPYFAAASTIKALKVFDEFEQVGRYGAAANFDPKAQKDSDV